MVCSVNEENVEFLQKSKIVQFVRKIFVEKSVFRIYTKYSLTEVKLAN